MTPVTQKEGDIHGNTACPVPRNCGSSHLCVWLPPLHLPRHGFLLLQACDAIMKDTYLPDVAYDM